VAEEPVFEDQLEPLHYPHPVSEDLRPGKVAVIIEVPAKQAMVQVGDRVDVLCSMSSKNAAFGPGSTATAGHRPRPAGRGPLQFDPDRCPAGPRPEPHLHVWNVRRTGTR